MWKTKIPEKPKTQKEQISVLWDFVTNHVFSKLSTHDTMMRFILAFTALTLAFLAILVVLIARG